MFSFSQASSSVCALLAATLLVGCGGGGGGGDDVVAVPPASGAPGCAPSRAAYDSVVIGASPSAAAVVMGCAGELVSQMDVAGLTQYTYQWGTVSSGPYVQMTVRDGRVTSKTARQLDAASAPSLCLPTVASVGALPIGVDVTTVVATLGCAGELVSESATGGVSERTLVWGSVTSGPFVDFKFTNGVMTSRFSQGLTPAAAASSCVPTRVSYDTIVQGLDIAAVQQRLGCAGQLLNDVLVAGLARRTYAWGNAAMGPYAQVTFDGGLVSSKMASRLEAVVSANCTPTQARFDALAPGATLASVQATMGCGGEQINNATVSGVNQVSQAWGSPASGAYVMVTLRADQLTAKLAQHLDGAPGPAACLPTSPTVAALRGGLTFVQASATIGCSGWLLTEVVTGSTNEKTYSWGSVVSGPYLQAKFRNGALASWSSTRL